MSSSEKKFTGKLRRKIDEDSHEGPLEKKTRVAVEDLKDDAVKIEEVVRNLSLSGGLSSSIATKRLAKDFQEMSENPPLNISVRLKEGSLFKWEATIQGTVGSSFESFNFLMDINFTDNYPFAPPKVIIRTKINHCNVGSDGKLSISILDDSQWSYTATVKL